MLTFTPPQRSLLLGSDIATGEPVRLARKLLPTHLHVLGPTGVGKTRLLLWLYRLLSREPDATVVLFNVKGDLGRIARDWTIADGMADRLTIFDPAQRDAIIGYNPLRPNGQSVAEHAMAAREAILAGWNQASIDQTPQLARLLFLTLAVVREMNLTLLDAVRLLQPRSDLRRTALRKVQDPFLREALAYFHSLDDTRQEQLAASTLARLEPFVNDEHIRSIVTQQARSLDLGTLIDEHKHLIVNLEMYRPLPIANVKLLGRLMINDLMAHVFVRPKEKRTPVYLIIDEVEVFATPFLCDSLAMGRELGLHCILAHQFQDQLRLEDGSGMLLSAVKNCALTKIVFGELSVEELTPIVKNLVIDQYDPMAVKDEVTHREYEPVESRRLVASSSFGRGRNWSDGTGASDGRSRQTGEGRGSGRSHMAAENASLGFGSGNVVSFGGTQTLLPSGDMTDSSFDGGAAIENYFGSRGTMRGSAAQEILNRFESGGEHTARHVSRNDGGSQNESLSLSLTPFYEYRKRTVVSSREFWKLEEFLITQLQRLRSLPPGVFVVKAPGEPAACLQTPFIDKPSLTEGARREGFRRIFSQPCYATPEQIAQEEEARRAARALPSPFGGGAKKAPASHKDEEDEAGKDGASRKRSIPKPPTD